MIPAQAFSTPCSGTQAGQTTTTGIRTSPGGPLNSSASTATALTMSGITASTVLHFLASDATRSMSRLPLGARQRPPQPRPLRVANVNPRGTISVTPCRSIPHGSTHAIRKVRRMEDDPFRACGKYCPNSGDLLLSLLGDSSSWGPARVRTASCCDKRRDFAYGAGSLQPAATQRRAA